ncbi:MAG: hypothetical protein IH626_13005 [Rhodospirillales bacterium]|nr:hypothetical protein [Rhodospirillales bacterium]
MLGQVLAGVTDTPYLRRRARVMVATTVAYIVAAVMTLMAVISALAAAYAGLREAMMPAWAAALVICACFLVLALAALLVARRRQRPASSRVAGSASFARGPAGVAADAMAALAPLVDDAVRTARERPGEAVLTALVAGIVAGTLRRP